MTDAGRAPRRFYVDTSAYLRILLAEDGWEALADELAGSEMLSSALLVLETSRNLIRLTRDGRLPPNRYAACVERLRLDRAMFVFRDLTIDLCESAVIPPIATPRSLDLAHLRTALWFHSEQPLARFVTIDAVQRQAARDVGLPV